MTLDADDRPRVFIVDDDEAVRDALGILARAQGWEVHLFDSAPAFLAESPRVSGSSACLVVDLQMPKMNGAELLEHLKDTHQQLPTIVLTAWSEGKLASRALDAGASQVMAKPFDPVHWLNAVREVLVSKAG